MLWTFIVAAVMFLALYVSVGRFLMSNVEAYREDILRELNSRSPFTIEARDVSGQWHSFTPEIVLSRLRLSIPGSTERPLELAEGRVAINVWESLKTLSLKTYRVSLDQLLLRGELTSEGKLLIAGLPEGDGSFGVKLEAFLLAIDQIELINNQLILDLPDLSQRLFDLNLILRREGSQRVIDVNLVSHTTGTEITVLGQGVGNPRSVDTFKGGFYLNVVKSDLQSLQRMLPQDPGVRLTGELDVQAWMSWDRGRQTLTTALAGRELSIEKADRSWKVPVDYLAMEASLEQSEDHWRLFASELEIRNHDEHLRIPRLRLDVSGDSLGFSANEVPLAPLNTVLFGLGPMPEALAEVFRILDPRGELTSVRLNVADYAEPLKDWDFTGNFTEFEVQSWNGAPGVKADKGYVELAPDGGFVIIDSKQFSMAFPTIYRESLDFDDFYGTINLDWTATEVSLSSGLVVASGAEGTARALFDLNIPLSTSPVGLEMELLVGLENTHPIHRTKYLPYTLNGPLLRWLKSSIGEGEIEEGAFLWRGSLLRDSSELRTVQLFFNIADTDLDYYQGWPSLSGVEGMVLIDDSKVSVWSQNAKLYDSAIEFLSVEAWLNDSDEMMLAIDSAMRGDASDGLQIVNESPIAEMVGDAFSDWALSGELDTRLDLLLNLSDAQVTPVVDVQTRFQGVDLNINPGALLIEDIAGQLGYSSERGLHSSDLVGSIWGEEIQADVYQSAGMLTPDDSLSQPYNVATSATEVRLVSRVEFDSIRDWLNLELLEFAQGSASVNLLVEVEPGTPARVSLDSDLVGVAMDLPEPWRKDAASPSALHLDLPLAKLSRQLKLELGSNLYLDLMLNGERLEAMSLGVNRVPEPLVAGVVRVGGRTSYLDVAQWETFLDRYVYREFEQKRDNDAQSIQESSQVSSEGRPAAPEVRIDNFRAATLRIFDQSLQDVSFSLARNAAMTHVAAETDWVAGELFHPGNAEPVQLNVSNLDLARLKGVLAEDGSEGAHGLESLQASDIPDIDVTLAGLHHGGAALGSLRFGIRGDNQQVIFDDIIGDFAGLSSDEQNPASLVWDLGEASGETRFNAQLGFEDLGKTLEQLSYQSIVETSSGKIDLNLNWPGGPQEFSLNSALGSLELEVAEGRFLNTPVGTSGTLKVVGILNLANIVQRLSLDLSDVFSSGIPFHNIDGEVFFHGGQIEVSRMKVEGRSSGFQFTGISDVATQSLDGELIATLPVANNLPWVAALAAGLPVAAGVFVVSKVFEKQMNRFSSAVYKIEGSWEDPQVNFDRVFDLTSASDSTKPPDPNTSLESEGKPAAENNGATLLPQGGL